MAHCGRAPQPQRRARERGRDRRPQVMTAIGKRAVEGRPRCGPLGIEGDEQADLSVHGGPSKAVYAYPSEHYPFWQTVRAQAGVAPWDEPLPPGSLGENLTLAGVVESEVFDRRRAALSRLRARRQRAALSLLQVQRGDGLQARRQADGRERLVRLVPRGARARHDRRRRDFEIVPGPREVGIGELFRARTGAATRPACSPTATPSTPATTPTCSSTSC